MKKIVILTSGSGSLIERALKFDFFKESISLIVVDRVCGAIKIAKKFGISFLVIKDLTHQKYSDYLLKVLQEMNADYVLSYSNLKILKGEILERYRGKMFNSHFSILPAFKGFYHNGESQDNIPARQIFERTIKFGSRICGNTIHLLDERLDMGKPLIVGLINIPYLEDLKMTRHRLFEVELKTILQATKWLCFDRVVVTKNPTSVSVSGVSFDKVGYSPNLEIDDLKL